MTTMNFNAIGSQQLVAQQSKPLVLREGQVFHGSIKQLFPNQVAEVQVGSNKLVAKLEVPLKAGDSHYFQVTNTTGQVELKVVTGPMNQAASTQQMNQLMDSMNLPKSAEMRQILNHFISSNIPVLKEHLMQAEAWLKAMPNNESKTVALQAITRMIDLKMPFTNDVFQALLNGSKTTGMSDVLSTLMQRITQDATVNNAVKANIQNQIQLIQQPLMQQVGGNVLATLLTTLLNDSSSMENKSQLLTLMKQAGLVNEQATLSNFIPTTSSASTSRVNIDQLMTQLVNSNSTNVVQAVQNLQMYILQDQLLSQQQKAVLNQQLEQFMQTPKTNESIIQFAKQLENELIKIHATNQLANPSLTNNQGLTPKDQLLSLLKLDSSNHQPLIQLAKLANSSQVSLIQTMVQNAELTMQANIDSKQIEQAMKVTLRSLGLNYEAILSSNKMDQLDNVIQSLKPQLMQLINDGQISLPVRETAELILARINGMQLLSTDNGYQHQIVMQVPLDFLGKRMDATMHWNGRMKDDGQIDSDFARILFYLQMESLKETVIDMQVQNRIVSLTVFNENTNLQPIASGLKELLAVGLDEKGYQLSGVQLKTFENQNTSMMKDKATEDTPRSGVDIRI